MAEFTDPTLKATLEATGAPRILTTLSSGEAVYAALDAEGNVIVVDPSEDANG